MQIRLEVLSRRRDWGELTWTRGKVGLSWIKEGSQAVGCSARRTVEGDAGISKTGHAVRRLETRSHAGVSARMSNGRHVDILAPRDVG
jgi:hypothetical protein